MRPIDADKLKELYQGYEGYSIPSEVILQNIDDQPTVYNPVERAYEILVATYNTKDIEKEDALIAIGEAIGYLGEVLD